MPVHTACVGLCSSVAGKARANAASAAGVRSMAGRWTPEKVPMGPADPILGTPYTLHPTPSSLTNTKDRVLLSLLPSFPHARTWPAVSPPLSLARSLSLALSRVRPPPFGLCVMNDRTTSKLNQNLKLNPKYAGLNDAFNKDTFKDKMNLGVGAYRDDNGKVVVYIL